MVKLRVTARVIPEDAYLSAVESSQAQTAPIRGEKRFYVIIRDPEDWYIGTLALEIKKRYESLYRHDLGQIKYLKDNLDDCDLDPELYVSDALVDEGKVLTDPSDQHVTVKVIQEQGRAIRSGSVVPDLSQVHYRLPERPVRPPVPAFLDVGPSLGKRKPENNVQQVNTERKRMRLDQIEEEGLVASIENQSIQSELVIPATQTPGVQSPTILQSHSKGTVSPELTWSFDRIGPPTIVQADSGSVQGGLEDVSRRSSGKNISKMERARNQTPNTTSRSAASPHANGVSVISPLAAASSASKKFLMPRREVLTSPDLDIDDSQMSPNSRDTSRITPRLVPSGKANDLRGSLSKSRGNAIAAGSPIPGRKGVERFNREIEQQRDSVNSGQTKEDDNLSEPGSSSNESAESDNEKSDIANEDSAAHPVISEKSLPATMVSQMSTKSALRPDLTNGLQHGADASLSDASSTSLRSNSRRFGRNRKRTKPSKEKPELVGMKTSHRVSTNSEVQTPPLKRLINTSEPLARQGADDLSTPGADSASEQLFQTLQESARKAKSVKTNVSTTKRPRASKSDKGSVSTKIIPKGKKQDETQPINGTKLALTSSDHVSSTNPVIQRVEIGAHQGMAKYSSNAASVLAVPTDDRGIRESSIDSRVTTNSKVIVPNGMTPEEYEHLVKSNAHLNASGIKSSTKSKSTPSLRQTSSMERPISNVATVHDKSTVPLVSTALAPSKEKQVTTDVGISATETQKKAKSKATSNASKEIESKIPTEGTKHTDNKKPPVQKSSTKTSSLVQSESMTSEKSKASPAKTSVAKSPSASISTPTGASKPAPLPPSKSVVPASSQLKESTPASSIASKITSSSTTKNKPKAPGSSTTKAAIPPSSSSVTKTSSAATPTPKSKPQSKTVLASNSTATTNKPATKSTTRPTLPPTFSSARTLQELRAMANSANTSQSNSPGPSTSRFAPPKKSLLAPDDESDSSSESDSESSSASPPPSRKATAIATSTAVLSSQPRSKSTPKPSNAKPSISKSQPDPTIRDVSSDDNDSEDDDD